MTELNCHLTRVLGIFLKIAASYAFGRLRLRPFPLFSALGFSRHMTIQLHHRSLNQKITRPEEASRMRCDTIATKKQEVQMTRIIFNDTWMIKAFINILVCYLHSFPIIVQLTILLLFHAGKEFR